jgi:hypothetical protein
MAIRNPAQDSSPYAEIRLPMDWLMPWLDLETVKQAQRPDTHATLTSEYLTLSGLEITVERRWLRESHWRQLNQALVHGYIYRSTQVQVTLRGDRRERDRRTGKLAKG